MILLDTHIWIWWADGGERLSSRQQDLIQQHEAEGLGVSVISVWEVAKLVERGRFKVSLSVDEWCRAALSLQGINLLPITPEIAIDSTRLGRDFQKDPADQIIVATARVLNMGLLTGDARIMQFPQVPLAV